MDRPALLVLVRHGESHMNVAKKDNIYVPQDSAGLVKGIPDHKVELTGRGKQQALQTGIYLREKFGTFDVVYDSGYARTRQTREGLLAAYSADELAHTKIRQSHLIRERERGYTFDMTTREAETHFPWLKNYYDTFGHFYARPPGGQSQADLCDQVQRFIGLLFAQRAGEKVLVVTHGHTLRAFRFNLEKWTPEQYDESVNNGCKFDNCGITAYRLNPQTGKLDLECYNEVLWK